MDRITVPYLYKYEKVKILSILVDELSKIHCDKYSTIELINLAKQDLYNKKVDKVIERKLPNGSVELWNVKELKILKNEKN